MKGEKVSMEKCWPEKGVWPWCRLVIKRMRQTWNLAVVLS